MAPDQLVMVSDKAKPEQDPRCRAKDQSIHIFRVPGSVTGAGGGGVAVTRARQKETPDPRDRAAAGGWCGHGGSLD